MQKAIYNGYTAIVYGESSLVVRDPDGYEMFHTGARTKKDYTESELQKVIKNAILLYNLAFQDENDFRPEEVHHDHD